MLLEPGPFDDTYEVAATLDLPMSSASADRPSLQIAVFGQRLAEGGIMWQGRGNTELVSYAEYRSGDKDQLRILKRLHGTKHRLALRALHGKIELMIDKHIAYRYLADASFEPTYAALGTHVSKPGDRPFGTITDIVITKAGLRAKAPTCKAESGGIQIDYRQGAWAVSGSFNPTRPLRHTNCAV